MDHIDIVRAWKDEAYRNSLSADELALLPPNPAGLVELHDSDLEDASGGDTAWICLTISISVAVSVEFCSPNGTFCGTCNWGTHGCC